MKHTFAHHIIKWYHLNKRDLPWRNTKNPYYIWLSEIILQQTRVAQGMPYYVAFTDKYPSVTDLAQAEEQSVLKLWQGLGYYSRARNLHFTAQTIVQIHKGIFPDTYSELIKLKGIGDYTAAAIASFAFDEIVPTVDGNVYRVLSRYFGIETPINLPVAKKEFKNLANELIDPLQPGTFNQAIMEFGALQCVPVSPNCNICPLNDSCLALQMKKTAEWPIKLSTIKIKKRYFNYLVIHTSDGQTVLQKREKNDIWKHLYEFPLLESNEEWDENQIIEALPKMNLQKEYWREIQLLNVQPIKHKLTHQEIQIKFWKIEYQNTLSQSISWEELTHFPLPIVIHNFVEKNKLGVTF